MFDDRFERALVGRVVLDIGCGWGAQVLAAAQAGSAFAVGVDKSESNIQIAVAYAAVMGLDDRVRLTTEGLSSLGSEWADVVFSQNAFEHFDRPDEILAQAFNALKPGGECYITFAPPWWHPYGVHHMYMIRMPWAHWLFSERTILRVRRLFRPSAPTCWRDTGLNQMTIARLLQVVRDSPFKLTELSLTPIHALPRWMPRLRLFREWTTAVASVILTKPRSPYTMPSRVAPNGRFAGRW